MSVGAEQRKFLSLRGPNFDKVYAPKLKIIKAIKFIIMLETKIEKIIYIWKNSVRISDLGMRIPI